MPQAPLLAVEHVSLHYRPAMRPPVAALADLSFTLRQGERVVLLGPSGCGKSSLLNAVAGFVPVTAGRISIGGRPIGGPGPDRMVVFQEFDQLLPWQTVIENVAFPLRIARRLAAHAARRVAEQHLARVGLADFAEAYPHTLSGGMKQRVAIARALALQPELLLMDEPFAALDALTRRQMQQELLDLWQVENFAMLFVTHAIDEAIVLADRIIALSPRPGRLAGIFDASAFGYADRGSPGFAALEQQLHALLLPAAQHRIDQHYIGVPVHA
jgi:NitT/TauT family transport system ATP-binding protein